jgi:ArsR family transcriptional regulator
MDVDMANLAIRIDGCQYMGMECSCGTSVEVLDEAHADHVAGILKALADPNRLRIVAMLGSAATADVCVCDLTEPLGLSQPTVSHHMKVLREAGIVAPERRGKWVHFRLADDLPDAARAVLGEVSPARR